MAGELGAAVAPEEPHGRTLLVLVPRDRAHPQLRAHRRQRLLSEEVRRDLPPPRPAHRGPRRRRGRGQSAF